VKPNLEKNHYHYAVGMEPGKSYRQLYKDFLKAGAVLVIVNPEVPDPLFFDAGVLHLPAKLRQELLASVYTGDEFSAINAALQGLTYKEVLEVLHMTTVMFGQITAQHVRHTRRSIITSVPGVRHLHDEQAPYIANTALSEWLETDGPLFQQDKFKTLRPKGLLFTGKPGTGKTEGAKWLAKELQVPLYLLDITALSSKYYSESERNLTLALRQIEQLSPCVMLIDEIEKLFIHTDDSGTTGRLLSSLLWWLQSRTANVLTVMTTNNEEKLPQELYRTGRIDTSLDFPLLSPMEADDFGIAILHQYESMLGIELPGYFADFSDYTMGISHADVVGKVLKVFKQAAINELT
jgi:hypothetical protein